MLLLPFLLLACGGDASQKDHQDSPPGETAPLPPAPIVVSGGGSDVEIAGDVGDSQGEPSAIAVDDSTIVAAWMEESGYTIYMKMVRSTEVS